MGTGSAGPRLQMSRPSASCGGRGRWQMAPRLSSDNLLHLAPVAGSPGFGSNCFTEPGCRASNSPSKCAPTVEKGKRTLLTCPAWGVGGWRPLRVGTLWEGAPWRSQPALPEGELPRQGQDTAECRGEAGRGRRGRREESESRRWGARHCISDRCTVFFRPKSLQILFQKKKCSIG